MIDVDLIQQCADPHLEVAIVQQFVAEMNALDHLTVRVFQGDLPLNFHPAAIRASAVSVTP